MDPPLSIQSECDVLFADLETYEERISESIDDWLGSEGFKSPVNIRKGASVVDCRVDIDCILISPGAKLLSFLSFPSSETTPMMKGPSSVGFKLQTCSSSSESSGDSDDSDSDSDDESKFLPNVDDCCVDVESGLDYNITSHEVDCYVDSSPPGFKSPTFSPSSTTSDEPHEVSFCSDAGGKNDDDDASDDIVSTTNQVNEWGRIFQKPAAAARTVQPTSIVELEGQPQPVICREVGAAVIDIPPKYLHDGFLYTKRNTNINEVQYKCMHERAKKYNCCKGMLYLPLTDGGKKVIARPRLVNKHSEGCASKHGRRGDYNWEGKMSAEALKEYNDGIESPSKKLKANDAGEIHQPNIDARVTMKILAEELAIKKLAARPKDVAIEVYNEVKKQFPNGCIVEDDKKIADVVRTTRKDMGQGNNLSTIESTYSMMKDMDRAFLHFTGSWPHPTEQAKKMKMMIFGNPALINLLRAPMVDLFVDATFRCCPKPFEQCLIVMVYEHYTRSYVPVFYILMTNKFESQYVQAFFQVSQIVGQKLNVRTYTSDFERALMNGLDEIFGGDKGGVHVGCFFHLKQAWRKYLVETVKMPSDTIVKEAMRVGSLDLLCIIPRNEIVAYGIPYLRSLLEKDQTDDVKNRWKLFWKYFFMQWIPIIKDWNICKSPNEYITMVNRTNNGIESYNNTINELYKKKPTPIKFVTILEEESRNQAANWLKIASGQKRDNSASRQVRTVPEIPPEYTSFKGKLERKIKRDRKKAEKAESAAAAAAAKVSTAAPTAKANKLKKGKK